MKYILVISIFIQLYAKDVPLFGKYESDFNSSIKDSNGTQKRVLESAYKHISEKKIIKGSCWDYINSIYKNANVKKEKIFISKKSGPYANLSDIKAGDWLYHINLSYKNIEHSGLFIKWLDRNNSIALMLSYAGENKNRPARLKKYDISKTYQITRAKEDNVEYLSIKEYARKHKISIFQAVKLSKSGKVETKTEIVDGKEQIFIKDDKKEEKKETPKKVPTIEELIKEIEELKQRVKKLEEKL